MPTFFPLRSAAPVIPDDFLANTMLGKSAYTVKT